MSDYMSKEELEKFENSPVKWVIEHLDEPGAVQVWPKLNKDDLGEIVEIIVGNDASFSSERRSRACNKQVDKFLCDKGFENDPWDLQLFICDVFKIYDFAFRELHGLE